MFIYYIIGEIMLLNIKLIKILPLFFYYSVLFHLQIQKLISLIILLIN